MRSDSRRSPVWLTLALRPALPSWLVSAVVHLLFLIALALLVAEPPKGLEGGIHLLASLSTSSDDGDDAATAVTLSAPIADGQTAADLAAALSASGSTAPTTLADALGGGPPTDPSGSLPSIVAALGSAALEGGMVGSAADASAGPRGGGPVTIGGKARTSVFGAQGEGHKFVYVFDRSASMGGSGRNALNAAKIELLASLRALGQTHQFQILFYNEWITRFNPSGEKDRLIFANERNKNLAEKFVGSVTADAGTRHEEALVEAISLRPDVIFFLTDADEPRLWPAQLEKIHRMASGITINTIEFGFGPQSDRDNFLVRLAQMNGGQHVYVDISKLFPVAAGY
ncbi:MAG: hypothetical protein ACOY3P_04385 [Planctomycetota bacterium]